MLKKTNKMDHKKKLEIIKFVAGFHATKRETALIRRVAQKTASKTGERSTGSSRIRSDGGLPRVA